MTLPNAFEDVFDDPVQFTELMCPNPHEFSRNEQLIQHDGHVVCRSDTKSFGTESLLRVLYESVTEPERRSLIISPTPPAASGSMLLLLDIIEESAFREEQWGIETDGKNTIEFDNGSRIESVSVSDSHASDTVRGRNPDQLVVDHMESDDKTIPETVLNSIIAPMYAVGDGPTTWMNTDSEDRMVDAIEMLNNDGVLVYRR